MLATLLCGCGPTGADVWAQEQKERKAKQEAAAAKEAEAAKAAAEEELRKQRIDRSLLKKLKVTKDAMRGLTFYSAGSLDSNGKYMKLYIAEDSDGMLLRLKIQYHGRDWLFVDRVWTRIDDLKYNFPSSGTWGKDNSAYSVWEWSDKILYKGDLVFMKEFLKNKSPTIRFEGNQYFDDFKLPVEQVKSMNLVLSAYEAAIGEVRD